ncbi:hypothetical protein [Paenibacillus sp.]|jgi:hypothetical protein|uniref:hypothetical protein n=1 Tax=Paenibacillus sp. TaxID=58172 RepID=UPI0028365FC4|nr:hypothetical protein [Paenibacillus sp.]MDR0267309.1 hypothetical protein [Paenibacillus sp.]
MKFAIKAAVVASGIAMLFGTANMVGATSANNSAQVVTAKAPAADQKAVEAAKKELSEKMLPSKNTGDMYLLYVADKNLNGGSEFLYYLDMFQSTSYEDYLNQAAKLQGPVLQKPEGLSEGYKFVKGNIQPPIATNRAEYQKEVKAEAEAQGKGVYYKKFDWKEMGEVNLAFANGKDNLQMQVSHKIDKNKPNGGYSYRTADEFDAELAKKHPEWVRNVLSWSDEDHVYNITTNPGNPLTKEDLIKFAETVVKK